MKRDNYTHVTEVIAAVAQDDGLAKMLRMRPDVIEAAARRGSAFQMAAEHILRRQAIPKGIEAACEHVDDRYFGWRDSLIEFWKRSDSIIVTKSFHRMYDDREKLTGEFDFEAKSDKKTVLMDLKVTASVSTSIMIQLGGYLTLRKKKIDLAAVLHAPISGKPKLHWYPVDDCIREWNKAFKDFKKLGGSK